MKNRRNYYRILHVQPDAPADIIKSSYRTLMQKLKMHPDLGGDEWDASVLNEAYQVLSNPARRAAYDATFIGGQDGLRQAARQTRKRGDTDSANPQARNAAQPSPHDPARCAFCGTLKPAAGYTEQPCCNTCHAPLASSRIIRAADATERACDRLAHNAPLTLFLSVDDPGRLARLRDLSPAGLQLRFWHPLDTGTVVRIESHAVAAVGRVVFCNRAPAGNSFHVGIEFLTVQFHATAGTFVSARA